MFASPRRRALLALIPCLLGLFVAARYLQVMSEPATPAKPFADATWYLAAGERLNAGSQLYALGPGDRPVLILAGISTAPLLSPPPIAVIWQPIAALPFGFALWVIAVWVALLGTTFYLVYRTGLRGAIVATALAPAIGEQLAAANVAAFFPILLVVAWRYRVHPIAGVVVTLMASLKLAPATLFGWMIGTRQWRALVAAAVTAVAILVVCLFAVGIQPFADYVGVARTAGPSTLSVSGLTGVPWASAALLVAGTLIAAGLGRWPKWSFVAAVIFAVAGTPSLYLSGFVTLLGTMAPFAEPPAAPTVATAPIPTSASNWSSTGTT